MTVFGRIRHLIFSFGPIPLVRRAPPDEQGARGAGSASRNRLPKSITMLVADDRIDRRVLLQASSLVRAGARVTVVGAPYPGDDDLDAREFPEVTIKRVRTDIAVDDPVPGGGKAALGVGHDPREIYFYAHQFTKAALDNPASVFVAHDLPVLASACLAARMHGAKLVYDAHELYPEQLHFGPEKTALYADAESKLIRRADLVMTINPSIAAELSTRYGIGMPSVILNAPNTDSGTIPLRKNRLLRDHFNIPDEIKICLFQGSLSLNRNLEALVASFAHVKTDPVVLVAMGPGQQKREELEGIARQHGILDRKVYFHDPVSQKNLLSYTSGADFGVIPYAAIDKNTELCSPNKLFEFIVAGLPILANDLPELRRFVGSQGIGINRAMTDPASIAAAVDEMCRLDFSAFHRALTKVSPNMTWKKQGEAVVDLYRGLK